jgi:hypothetical protein
MPVRHQRRSIILLVRGCRCSAGGGEERWERQKVTAASWSGRYEGEDLGDEALLDGRILEIYLSELLMFSESIGSLRVGCRIWSV